MRGLKSFVAKACSLVLAATFALGTPALGQVVQGDAEHRDARFNRHPWVDVTNSTYGCLGDDSTDNSACIVTALAAVPTDGVLFFPAGIYRVKTTIDVTRGDITIMGDQALLKVDDDAVTTTTVTVFAVAPAAGRLTNVEFRGLRFVDPAADTHKQTSGGTEATRAIYVKDTDGVRVENVSFDGFGDECLMIENGTNVHVSENLFEDCVAVATTTTGGLYLLGNSQTVVSNNVFEANANWAAINVEGQSGVATDDILIEGNIINGPLDSDTNGALSGSCIDVSNTQAEIRRLHVEDNQCNTPATHGIMMDPSGSGTVVGAVIVGNTVDGGGATAATGAARGGGIWISDGATNGNITGNTVISWGANTTSHYGISVQEGGWVISSNRLTDGEAGGIFSDSSGKTEANMISTNLCTEASKTGIGIRAGSKDSVVSNVIDGAASGINVAACTQCLIEGNSIRDISGVGIQAADVAIIRDNLLDTVVGDGIDLTGTGAVVRENHFFTITGAKLDDNAASTDTLVSCDTIDSDADGVLMCGTDGGTGVGEWTDAGSLIHPADGAGLADNVVIGGTVALIDGGPDALFSVIGHADQPQMIVDAHSTQTEILALFRDTVGATVFSINNNDDILADRIRDVDGPGTNWTIAADGAAQFQSMQDATGPGTEFQVNAGGDARFSTIVAQDTPTARIMWVDEDTSSDTDDAVMDLNCLSDSFNCSMTFKMDVDNATNTDRDIWDITASGGAVDVTFGTDTTYFNSFTVATGGTGTSEVVLPAGSIDGTEILDATVSAADMAAGFIDATTDFSTTIIPGLFLFPLLSSFSCFPP